MKVSIVKIEKSGLKYFFDTKDLDVSKGDNVVVETPRGIELGSVISIISVEDEKLTQELVPFLRHATEEDFKAQKINDSETLEVVVTTKDLVKKHNLDMSVLDAEYTLDRKRLLIYFEAEERVDFRELVKDLSYVYQTRIELRQIGSRDGAKIVGGIGPCGRILCCKKFIDNFDVITIRMAKNQNMALNPSKTSGACDKLLCCIKYENEAYTYLKESLPVKGDKIKYKNEVYDVKEVNLLRETVLIIKENDEQERIWLKKDQYERVK
ncbi:MAG TPA: regulatory iron-sulfur-containing complex subunit RicT [Acholeplasmataceae bacterium]|nr:regulatory iron-sulfur-containing complex subunit RicT [Acholeplasmataceae bacterium]